MVLTTAAPAFAGKIGFVDAERAVGAVQEGRAKLRALEEWARPRRERVQELQRELEDLRQKIAQQRSVASGDVLEKLEADELRARRSYEDARRSFERDLEAKQNEFLSEVAVKVGSVASDYGRRNDYDAIFVLRAQPLIYVAEPADLTETIIRLYDERFPYQEE
jgi:Skp family chaperone for outer membrane proteins